VASNGMAKPFPLDAQIHKWPLLRAICEGLVAINLSDQALGMLSSFHVATMRFDGGSFLVSVLKVPSILLAHRIAVISSSREFFDCRSRGPPRRSLCRAPIRGHGGTGDFYRPLQHAMAFRYIAFSLARYERSMTMRFKAYW
jgi:hypothetical protein